MTVIIFRYDITVTQHWGLEEVEAAVYLVVISPSENKGTIFFYRGSMMLEMLSA